MIRLAITTLLLVVAVAGCSGSKNSDATVKINTSQTRAEDASAPDPTPLQAETNDTADLVEEILRIAGEISAVLPAYYRQIPAARIEKKELEFNVARVLSDLFRDLAALSDGVRTGIITQDHTARLSYAELIESKQVLTQLWATLPHPTKNASQNSQVKLAAILAAYPSVSEEGRNLKQLVERLGLPVDSNLTAELSRMQSTR